MRGLHQRLRVGHGAHVRRQHATRPGVERVQHQVWAIRLDSHEHRHAGRVGGANLVFEDLVGGRTVLLVEDREVEAGVSDHLD